MNADVIDRRASHGIGRILKPGFYAGDINFDIVRDRRQFIYRPLPNCCVLIGERPAKNRLSGLADKNQTSLGGESVIFFTEKSFQFSSGWSRVRSQNFKSHNAKLLKILRRMPSDSLQIFVRILFR
ncbi:MAG: hypothetical protein ABSC01_07550 [Verrucomicrobiota bacterium]